MERFVGKIAVITGAGTGIGAAITEHLIEHGLIVIGLGRRECKLQDLKNKLNDAGMVGKFHLRKCDISNEEDVIATYQWINENFGCLHILINNAAVFIRTSVLDSDPQSVQDTFNINVKGLLLCSQLAIKLMIENSVEGHIVNISSITANPCSIPKPNLGVYSSSKHAVRVLTERLRREMIEKKLKIKISMISPGLVKTELTASTTVPLLESNFLSVEDVAKACLFILNTSPNVLVSDFSIIPVFEYV